MRLAWQGLSISFLQGRCLIPRGLACATISLLGLFYLGFFGRFDLGGGVLSTLPSLLRFEGDSSVDGKRLGSTGFLDSLVLAMLDV